MDWMPIETWDYEAQAKLQHTMFPKANVSDGASVSVGSDWGPPVGWHDELEWTNDGPEKLGFSPTHWMPLPAPPTS